MLTHDSPFVFPVNPDRDLSRGGTHLNCVVLSCRAENGLVLVRIQGRSIHHGVVEALEIGFDARGEVTSAGSRDEMGSRRFASLFHYAAKRAAKIFVGD